MRRFVHPFHHSGAIPLDQTFRAVHAMFVCASKVLHCSEIHSHTHPPTHTHTPTHPHTHTPTYSHTHIYIYPPTHTHTTTHPPTHTHMYIYIYIFYEIIDNLYDQGVGPCMSRHLHYTVA